MIGDRFAEVHVDMGYRGHDYAGTVMVHVDKRTRGRTPKALWRWMKRRAAVATRADWLVSRGARSVIGYGGATTKMHSRRPLSSLPNSMAAMGIAGLRRCPRYPAGK